MAAADPGGNADFPQVEMLPEFVCDAREGRPIPAGYGVAECPQVVLLPEVVFDCRNPADAAPPISAVVLVAHGAAPPADLQPLLAALTAHDRTIGGRGLTVEPVGANGTTTVRLTAVEPAGAADRLRAIADLVNRPDASSPVTESAARVRAALAALAGYRVEAVAR